MRIEGGALPPNDAQRANKLPIEDPRAVTPSFAQLLNHKQTDVEALSLQQHIQRVIRSGDMLMKTIDLYTLHKYKEAIRLFLEKTARKSVGIQQHTWIDRQGRKMHTTLLEALDAHLIALADELVTTEAGRLAVLDCIGEMRGLLLHVRF
jgi:uncharacterized protein YaaR (DUF327 family)